MCQKSETELKTLIEKYLGAAGLLAGACVEAFSGPRRLTASVSGLRLRQSDVVKEVTGPPRSVAYDHVGAPTRAAVSFAEKQGVSLDQISFISTPKGEYLAVRQMIHGRAASEILAQILPRSEERRVG